MDLGGWSTVSAVSFGDLNRTLAERNSDLIGRVSFTTGGMPRLRCDVELGTWQVARGSTATLLRLSVPITAGEARREDTGYCVSLAGATAILAVALTRVASRVGATAHDYVFDFERAASLGEAPEERAVTPVAFLLPEAMQQVIGTAADSIVNGLASALSRERSGISFIFATVGFTDPAVSGWLQPHGSGYDTLAVDGVEYLAVLTTTADQPADPLQRIVDPALVRGGAPAAFAMAPGLFLQHVLLPIMANALGGEGQSAIVVSDGERRITQSRPFTMMPVRAGLIDYYPRVLTLDVNPASDGIAVAVTGDCDLKAGISMTWAVNASLPLGFDPARQAVFFSADPNPVVTHQADIPWWFFLIAFVPAAVAGIVGKVVSDSIASSLSTQLASTGLTQTSTTSVRWPGVRPMTVTEARMDGALILRGHV